MWWSAGVRNIWIAIVSLCLSPAVCMYQDEVGMHDWALKNVGPPSTVHFASHNRLYVGSPAGVAAVSVNDGDILWRHMGSGAVRDLVVVQKVVAVSVDKTVRAYKPSTGEYMWEIRTDDLHQLSSFSRNGSDELMIVRSSQLQLVGPSGSVLVSVDAKDAGKGLSFYSAAAIGENNIAIVCRKEADDGAMVVVVNSQNGEIIEGPTLLPAVPNDVDMWKPSNTRLLESVFAVVSGAMVYSISLAHPSSWSTLPLKGTKYSFQGNALGNTVAVSASKTTSILKADVSSGSLSVLRELKSRGALGVVIRDNKVVQEESGLASTVSEGSISVDVLNQETGIEKPAISKVSLDGYTTLIGIAVSKGSTKIFICTSDYTMSMYDADEKRLLWSKKEAFSTVTNALMWQRPFSKKDNEHNHQRSSIVALLTDPTAALVGAQELFDDMMIRVSDAMDDMKATLLQQSPESDPISAQKRTKTYFNGIGANKLVVVASCSGKVIAMDSVSRQVVWEKYFQVADERSRACSTVMLAPGTKFTPKLDVAKTDAPLNLFLNPEPTGAVSESKAKIVVVNKAKSTIYWLDPATGDILHDELFEKGQKKLLKVAPLSTSFAHGTSGVTPVAVTTTDHKMYVLPEKSMSPAMIASIGEYNTFEIDREKSAVVGYVRGEGTDVAALSPIWNFNFGKEKVVAATTLSHRERDHVPVHVRGDASVLYKFINRNLLTVVTERAEAHELVLHVIDAVTGRLLHRSVIHGTTPVHVASLRVDFIRALSHDQNLLSCDNWVIVHYWSEDSTRYEMSVTEFFESKPDEGPWGIIFGGAESSKNRAQSAYDLEQPVALEQSFIIGTGVSALGVTSTAKGITPRSLVMALNSNQVAVLNKDWINARRPIPDNLAKAAATEPVKIPTQFASTADEQIMPYSPVLVVPPTNVLSHRESVMGVRGVISSPTKLESTSLVFAYGLDCFFTVVQTANPYDLLSPGFNYGFLYASLAVVTTALIVTSKLAAKKALQDRWA